MSDEEAGPVPFGDFPDWYRPLFEVTDPEAAFEVACRHLRRKLLRGNPFRIHMALAEAWFEIAAGLAGSAEMRWRISAEHAEHGFDTNAQSWMRRAIRAEYPRVAEDVTVDPSTAIMVDPSTFAIQFDDTRVSTGQDFSVQVSSADPGKAKAALSAAAARFAQVTADGREFATFDELLELDDHEASSYSPNAVSDPEDHPAGPWIYSDCKDGIMPLMARTMLRIVVEELRAAGATPAQIHPAVR